MAYDPFARGPHPVAVHSGVAVDAARDGRPLPYDVLVPTAAGTDPLPLILFSHTSFGHRRQSTFLLDHLASHGYVVAAADHTGNAADDLTPWTAGAATRSDDDREAYIARIIADRAPDLRFLADTVIAAGIASIDVSRIGVIGWSFGGWAALATPEADDRFGAVVAMTPAGSSNPLPGIIPATLTFAYRGDVRVLYLAGEDDPYTPLPGIVELVGRTPAPARLFVLADAGHDHFGDAPQASPPPPDQAQAFTRVLTLAHFDAAMRGRPEAEAFLHAEAVDALAARGVRARQLA
jgi:dienelactone hydrolase